MPETEARPFLRFAVSRAETRHLLRALLRAAACAVRDALSEERVKARDDADAYDALRDRLLTEVAAREFRGSLRDLEEETDHAAAGS